MSAGFRKSAREKSIVSDEQRDQNKHQRCKELDEHVK
jgi:hypothetical protein